uniref:AAA family ATPase n=1 Tax=Marseillevirus LCMAC101 TaxID=2506602 RepID=A0A481YRE4_9VIRU|nr:MAG: AAA family ATPase [Marseillevirus LCMAC101]
MDTSNIKNFSTSGQTLEYLKIHVKEKLIDRLQTGDPIYDTIIAFLLLSSQDTVIRYICIWKDFIIYRFPWLVWRFLKWIKKRIRPEEKEIEMMTKTAVIKYITEGREINTLFPPILWYLNTLTDIRQEDAVTMETTKNNLQLTQTIPKNRTAEVEFLKHKIEYTITTEMISIYADREHKRENMIITLVSKTPKDRVQDILEQFAQMCIEKHEEYEKKKGWVQSIFRNEGGCWKGQPVKIKKMRKLNTVILKDGQMEKLTKDVNSFLHDEEWYLSRDVPYTRGYMFYGVPGTGKSSCIKALAGHTKRHVHYLILSEVKSDAELFKLLECVSFQETILVIEDIDAASKITHDRDFECKEKKEDEDVDHSNLTLSGLLNAIDGGIIQTHGRIMIVTTNHPEKLDPALVRAGRIDLKLNFGLCDTHQIRGLFFNFFEKDPPDNTSFSEGICSPADVTSILLEYKDNPDIGWEKVKGKFVNGIQAQRGSSFPP